MKIFTVLATFVHVLFLLSIFYIYFQSPVLENLPIGENSDNAVADRIVVFVADGLRAESFLKHQVNRTDFLQRTILSKGAFGISHTRVPTESRPGHVALFAGIYEDPSAVFKGWKENPVEFDSVFNRSTLTLSWGSPDILSIFKNGVEQSKMYTDYYSPEVEDFSRNSNTSTLDTWVFEKVKEFFSVQSNRRILTSGKQTILFLHLLGLDTSGHVHKPYSDLFTENLIIVDKGIQQTVELITQLVDDGRTTYIFTSDHGMTDKGSHGSGHPTETETPFVAWGAGIQYWKKSWNGDYSKTVVINDTTVPSWDLNQADVTPLISALLGLAVPKNNCGKLPRQYLNASETYIANSMLRNAEQLFHQYYHWRQQSNRKWFQWSLSKKEIDYSTIISKLREYMDSEAKSINYIHMITLCDILIDVTLEAIEYYHTYYKYELLFALSVAMIGWILIIVGKIFFKGAILERFDKKITLGAMFVNFMITLYNYLQGTPIAAIFYFTLPVIIWIPVISRWKEYVAMFNLKVIWQTAIFVGCVELCVISFFYRQVLSVFLIANTAFIVFCIYYSKGSKSLSLMFRVITSNVVLAIFPMLPVVEKDSNNPYLLALGTILWALANLVIVLKSLGNTLHRIVHISICAAFSLHMLSSIFTFEIAYTSDWRNKAFSWMFLILSLLVPLFTNLSLKTRITSVIMSLAGPFIMLSLSYEPLFLMAFSASLFVWMQAEDHLSNKEEQMPKLFFSQTLRTVNPVNFDDFRRSLTFVFYMLISFFGTGNMATVSSFDPNWVRLFVTTFSPFLITSLIVLKLLIPIFISVCVLKCLQIITKVPAQSLFLQIFIVCDLMCLQFFYLIKNKGSWLDIGSSISHFVIMECTTIVLILLYGCVKFMTEVSFVNRSVGCQSKIRYLLPFNDKTNKD